MITSKGAYFLAVPRCAESERDELADYGGAGGAPCHLFNLKLQGRVRVAPVFGSAIPTLTRCAAPPHF